MYRDLSGTKEKTVCAAAAGSATAMWTVPSSALTAITLAPLDTDRCITAELRLFSSSWLHKYNFETGKDKLIL
jgi:hypothetical protein